MPGESSFLPNTSQSYQLIITSSHITQPHIYTPLQLDLLAPLMQSTPGMTTIDPFGSIGRVLNHQPNVQFQVSLVGPSDGSGVINPRDKIPALGISTEFVLTNEAEPRYKFWKGAHTPSHCNSEATQASIAAGDLKHDLMPLLRASIRDHYADCTSVNVEKLESLFERVVKDYSQNYQRSRKRWCSRREKPSQIRSYRGYSCASPSSPDVQYRDQASDWKDQGKRCSGDEGSSGGFQGWAADEVEDERLSSSSYSSNSVDLGKM